MTDISLVLWQKFALAALIGLLVGLEREHSRQETEKPFFFAGIRTFPLIALLGCALAMLDTENQEWLFAIGFVSLVALLLIIYAASVQKGDIGLTTEIAVLLIYLIGGLVYWDHIWLAAALGGIGGRTVGLAKHVAQLGRAHRSRGYLCHVEIHRCQCGCATHTPQRDLWAARRFQPLPTLVNGGVRLCN